LLPSKHRLLRSRDFKRVYHQGKRVRGKLLQICWAPNRASLTRFGFSISKKIGKAVERNLLKRRLREICRQHLGLFLPGLDVVVVAQEGSGKADFLTLKEEIMELGKKAGIIEETEDA